MLSAALNMTFRYAVCLLLRLGLGEGGVGVLAMHAASAELRGPPFEVYPSGQRKHQHSAAFCVLGKKKLQAGARFAYQLSAVHAGT